jgi:hypothetical protein
MAAVVMNLSTECDNEICQRTSNTIHAPSAARARDEAAGGRSRDRRTGSISAAKYTHAASLAETPLSCSASCRILSIAFASPHPRAERPSRTSARGCAVPQHVHAHTQNR